MRSPMEGEELIPWNEGVEASSKIAFVLFISNKFTPSVEVAGDSGDSFILVIDFNVLVMK